MKESLRRSLSNKPRVYQFFRHAYKLALAGKEILFLRDGALNYFLCYISALLRLERSLGEPILLNIEPVNVCNLKCPVCETGAGVLERDRRSMSFDEFRIIIDSFGKQLKQVLFYFMGEPFLNNESYEMIRYAADRGIYVSSCTNGESVDPEKLVKSGIAEIQFQVGGTTQETHQRYRVGGDLEKCLANIRETVKIRQSYLKWSGKDKHLLRIGMGFIVMKHNEHEVEDFMNMARELGVDQYQVISPCVRTVEQAKEFLPSDERYRIYDEKALQSNELKTKKKPRNYCEWIYSTITVLVNGDVVPCCRDSMGKMIMGNLLNENMDLIWNGEKYRDIRRKIGSIQNSMELCAMCEGYAMPEI